MGRTRRLRQGEVTCSWAKEEETNILTALQDHPQRANYFSHLLKHSNAVWKAAAHHLSISPKECTYAWLKENCLSVPVPKLYGFALSTGQSFTAAENLPLLLQSFHFLCCYMLKLFGYMSPSAYVRRQGPCLSDLKASYLLIQYIDESEGTMLSCTWNNRQHDKNLCANLFKGLAQIILKLVKVPVPQIGSFVINNNGFLVLSNRPLSLEIHQLESEEIPVDIPRDMTYSSVDSYVADTLAFHDSCLHHQLNAINNEFNLTTMKTVASHFFKCDPRRGHFVYMLNNLHQSNILVNEQQNVRYLIDLEWACSRPIEMLHPPHWLTNQGVDMDTTEAELFNFNTSRVHEHPGAGGEAILQRQYNVAFRGYEPGMRDQNVLVFISPHDPDWAWFLKIIKHLWTQGIEAFIAKKLKEKAAYDKKLQEEFNILPTT
ncbi:hypothetical protein AJ80_07559 [Polytolypa hystricis UAMH7299]|uniref:Aminoglycoside phosphotransferase domain-containing protein n=1 Tax=Polytolypa hystricis (strain UAMH7299) TaxID=1447883 RepID=A0A2B7XMP9_POLH7|nr:hypothetical protein AJ80_07559 [Polytolypa hystricis UAMH7299]